MDYNVPRKMYRRYENGKLTKDELAKVVSNLVEEVLPIQIEERLKATNRLFRAAFFLCLYDKLDFNNQQLKIVDEFLEEILDSYEKGYLSIEDMEETLASEGKFELLLAE